MCDCENQTRDGSFPLLLPHLPGCSQFGRCVYDLLQELIHGIDRWAGDDDGIHPECWDAYKRARVAIGEPVREEQAVERVGR